MRPSVPSGQLRPYAVVIERREADRNYADPSVQTVFARSTMDASEEAVKQGIRHDGIASVLYHAAIIVEGDRKAGYPTCSFDLRETVGAVLVKMAERDPEKFGSIMDAVNDASKWAALQQPLNRSQYRDQVVASAKEKSNV